MPILIVFETIFCISILCVQFVCPDNDGLIDLFSPGQKPGLEGYNPADSF